MRSRSKFSLSTTVVRSSGRSLHFYLLTLTSAITLDSLGDMDLLHRCIKEALRMNPPLIFLMRKTEVPLP